jgi:hypothetical protein
VIQLSFEHGDTFWSGCPVSGGLYVEMYTKGILFEERLMYDGRHKALDVELMR